MSKTIYLKEILEESGIKQSFLAKKMEVSDTTVSLWVNGRSEPTVSNLKKICETLHVDIDLLVNGKKDWR